MKTDLPITELQLSTKPYKALNALGVTTIGDFLSINLDRIYEIPGMGNGNCMIWKRTKQKPLMWHKCFRRSFRNLNLCTRHGGGDAEKRLNSDAL